MVSTGRNIHRHQEGSRVLFKCDLMTHGVQIKLTPTRFEVESRQNGEMQLTKTDIRRELSSLRRRRIPERKAGPHFFLNTIPCFLSSYKCMSDPFDRRPYSSPQREMYCCRIIKTCMCGTPGSGMVELLFTGVLKSKTDCLL